MRGDVNRGGDSHGVIRHFGYDVNLVVLDKWDYEEGNSSGLGNKMLLKFIIGCAYHWSFILARTYLKINCLLLHFMTLQISE